MLIEILRCFTKLFSAIKTIKREIQMKGVIKNVSSKNFNGQDLWSFTMVNVTGFFQCGSNEPTCKNGDSVEISATQLPNGNYRVNSISVAQSAPTVQEYVPQTSYGSKPAYKKTSYVKPTGGQNREGYWDDKEVRDIETQKIIQLQSSRNSAIAATSLLITNGAIAGLDKAKVSDKMEIILALVDLVTDRYQQQVANAKVLKQVGGVKEPESLPIIEEKEEVWG